MSHKTGNFWQYVCLPRQTSRASTPHAASHRPPLYKDHRSSMACPVCHSHNDWCTQAKGPCDLVNVKLAVSHFYYEFTTRASINYG